jgi:hypothetical protein
MDNGNIKEILQVLYKQLEDNDPQVVIEAHEMIDSILQRTFNISPLSLHLLSIKRKDCVQNIYKLISGGDISDFDIAKALSSLVTHLIIATEKDPRKFQSLMINEVIQLLADFVGGKIERDSLVEFFNKYL